MLCIWFGPTFYEKRNAATIFKKVGQLCRKLVLYWGAAAYLKLQNRKLCTFGGTAILIEGPHPILHSISFSSYLIMTLTIETIQTSKKVLSIIKTQFQWFIHNSREKNLWNWIRSKNLLKYLESYTRKEIDRLPW